LGNNFKWRVGAGLLSVMLPFGISVHAEESIYTPQLGTPVHYNWGFGSPEKGFTSDHFSGLFDQSKNYSSGDYFVQTLADDRVKVEADGKWLIDRWSDSSGSIDRALWMGVTEGYHSVKTRYYENTGGAVLYSDILPFDTWLAYYYPNPTLSGVPTAAKVIQSKGEFQKLYEYHGLGGPVAGFREDNFSARYTTAKRISAGEYILRTRADDGVRVYVDGKLVLDRWTPGAFPEDAVKLHISDRNGVNPNEKNVHWIDVEYYEGGHNSGIEFYLEPYQISFDQTWIGEYYPNMSLEGIPYVVGGRNSTTKISTIDFNWGYGSPHRAIPLDRFSARFVRTEDFEEGMYNFEAISDDGLRVWVDDQIVIDSWGDSDSGKKSGKVMLTQGQHKIRVEYFENGGQAKLSLKYKKFEVIPTRSGENVHYNWGLKSPGNGISSDYYTGIFDQSKNFSKGDYFIQTLADDGVKVEVDGQFPVNRWSDSSAAVNRALWVDVIEGFHTVRTHYYENTGGATLYSDILPFDTWLAYYYPNTSLVGEPTAAKVIQPTGEKKKLYEYHGVGASVNGFQVDNFSARYSTAKRITSGEYILRARADDGIRVYVDGRLVLDRWTPGSFPEDAVKIQISDRKNVDPNQMDVHWIDVEYYEGGHNSGIEFYLEPYQNSFDQTWISEYYPNMSLEGIPYVVGGRNSTTKISTIDFNWGFGSPHKAIPQDRFSARYVKTENFEEGMYQFEAISDDGLRVWVDDQIVIDSWVNSDSGKKSGKVMLAKGQHIVKVEYFENGGQARLSLNYKLAPIQEPIILQPENMKLVSARKLPVYRSFEELIDYGKHLVFYNPSYTRFMELGYGDAVNVLEEKLYATKIKTSDGQIGWVQKDYLENSLTEDTWLVKEARALRSNASNSSASIGTVHAGSSVYVLDHVVTSGTTYSEWYYIQTSSGQKGWIWGASNPGGNEGYNIIKYEFNSAPYTNKVTIFTPLNTKANVTADQINRFIDYKTGGRTTVMTNMGYAYLKAQEETGLNAIYLLAHSGLETGWGNSSIVKAKYNFYGIRAIDSRPDEGAYNYSTPEGGIIAGAYFIKKNYVDRSWDTDGYFPYSSKPTIDNMRNDNSWHQYATDEAWAVKIGNFANEFYNFINK
jgi:beta-N-acetylglucosaminidase